MKSLPKLGDIIRISRTGMENTRCKILSEFGSRKTFLALIIEGKHLGIILRLRWNQWKIATQLNP